MKSLNLFLVTVLVVICVCPISCQRAANQASNLDQKDKLRREKIQELKAEFINIFNGTVVPTCSTWFENNVVIVGQNTGVLPADLFKGTLYISDGPSRISKLRFQLNVVPRIFNTQNDTDVTVVAVLLVYVPDGFEPDGTNIAPYTNTGLIPNPLPVNDYDFYTNTRPIYDRPKDVIYAQTFLVNNFNPSASSIFTTGYCLEADIDRSHIDLENSDRIMFLVGYDSTNVQLQNGGFTLQGQFNYDYKYNSSQKLKARGINKRNKN